MIQVSIGHALQIDRETSLTSLSPKARRYGSVMRGVFQNLADRFWTCFRFAKCGGWPLACADIIRVGVSTTFHRLPFSDCATVRKLERGRAVTQR